MASHLADPNLEPAPFDYGDPIELVHVGGGKHQATFAGVYGIKCTTIFVCWGPGSEYRVDPKTWQLMPRKASVWSVSPSDRDRLKATQRHEMAQAKARGKAHR